MKIAEIETREADQDLVAEALRGNCEAFAQIVARYQSLICSLTYSATGGDLARSEDLAQETFIAAWKGMRQLKEPAKLKSWLCGIARNIVRNATRSDRKEPTINAHKINILQECAVTEASPIEQVISGEEQALVRRALAGIPEAYREPLVLFYREDQSVRRVAAALDLSEDAIKQRLSRGRKMLSEQMSALVEGTLRQSAPGRAFTYGVIAALPMLSASATAATVSAVAAESGAIAKSAGLISSLTMVLGPLAGVFGAWFGVKASLDNAQTGRERREIIRCARIMVFYIGGFLLLLLGVMLPEFWRQNVVIWAAVLVTVWVGYVAGLFALIIYVKRRISKSISPVEKQKIRPGKFCYEYRSAIKLFGIPLLHVNTGGTENGQMRRAVGWIAFGDQAFGLVACGGLSVGLISLGGVAAGIFSVGGLSVGALAVGGCAVGHHVLAGLGFGMVGFGGLIVAWKMAVGGLAISHEIALGGMALAQHANDTLARAAVESNAFMQKGKWIAANGNAIVWLPILLVVWQGLQMRRKKRS